MAADNVNDRSNNQGSNTFANLAAQIKSKQRIKSHEQVKPKNLSPVQKILQNLPAAPERNLSQPLKNIIKGTAKPSTASLPRTGNSPPPDAVERVTHAPTLKGSGPSKTFAKAALDPQVAAIDLGYTNNIEEVRQNENAASTAISPLPPIEAGIPETKGLNPEQLYAMAKMGFTQWEYGKLDRARAIFQTLVVQKPDEPWFRCALGSIFQKQRHFAQAIQQYNIALQLDPKDIPSRVNRGEIFLKVGKPKEAREDLLEAVKIDLTGKHPAALRARSLLAAIRQNLPS